MNKIITRNDYQTKRLEFVSALFDVAECRGLEVGACDLPTVPSWAGACQYADFRSAEEMAKLWDLPSDTVVPVTFLLNRQDLVSAQIDERFDYVVACHVIEHIANPIGYIQDLQKLLDPNGAGMIILAAPDKRCTLDSSRLSTSLDHLLMDYHENARIPSLEHIMEFGRAWAPDLAQISERSILEYYRWAVGNLNSGLADAHCHVWTDEEFFRQMEVLTEDGILANLEVYATQLTQPGYNEFMTAFRNRPSVV